MKTPEQITKEVEELSKKVYPDNEDQQAEFSLDLLLKAKEIFDEVSSEQNGRNMFLNYLDSNYRDVIKGTSFEKDLLKLKSEKPTEKVSASSKPSDKVFMEALGAKDMKELLDWNWHNHWTKMPYADFKARAELAGIDPKSMLTWLQQKQTAYDRGEALEGREGPVEWLSSAAFGVATPRIKEAYKSGREPTPSEVATDIGVIGLQALPLGAIALPARAGGKIASYVLSNAAVPFAEEGLDALTSEDPYRKKFSPVNAVGGAAVNATTPYAIRLGARGLGHMAQNRGFAGKVANALEDFTSDPIQDNKKLLKEAINIENRGMAPKGTVMLDPHVQYASPEEYERALDLLVLDKAKEKGFFIPEMYDPKLRKELVKDIMDVSGGHEQAKLTKEALRSPSESRLPINFFEENAKSAKSPLEVRFGDVNPTVSSVHYGKRAGLAAKGEKLSPDVLEEFGTVMVDGKPRPAIFDQSLKDLGLEEYTSPERVKVFKEKYGWDPEGRHFADESQTASKQFERAKPMYEGAEILSEPTDWDKAVSSALEDPKIRQYLTYGDKYHGKDLVRLGAISLGTNKLGRGENIKKVPYYGQDLYDVMEKETKANEDEKAEINYYLNDPVTLRLWEFNSESNKNFQPRGNTAMRKAYEIWKAQRSK